MLCDTYRILSLTGVNFFLNVILLLILSELILFELSPVNVFIKTILHTA